MKKSTSLIVPLVVLLIATAFSCSVQKRRYSNGYHIVWKKPKLSTHEITSGSPARADLAKQTVPAPEAAAPLADKLPDNHLAQPLPGSVPPAMPVAKAGKSPSAASAPHAAAKKSRPAKRAADKASEEQLVLEEQEPASSPAMGDAAQVPITTYGNGSFGGVLLAVVASIVGLAVSMLLFLLLFALFDAGLDFLIIILGALFLIALVVIGIVVLINSD